MALAVYHLHQQKMALAWKRAGLFLKVLWALQVEVYHLNVILLGLNIRE